MQVRTTEDFSSRYPRAIFLIAAFTLSLSLCLACTTTRTVNKGSGWMIKEAQAVAKTEDFKGPIKATSQKNYRPLWARASNSTNSTFRQPILLQSATGGRGNASTGPKKSTSVQSSAGKANSKRDAISSLEKIDLGLEAADSAMARPKERSEAHLIFDIPVTYNSKVKKWIHYFQTTGRPFFRRWLERSSRYIPSIQAELIANKMPLDLAFVAMIESGFSDSAVSHANAMGLWQFIVPTGNRYGLKTEWWIDERRDFTKSTGAALRYMSDLFEQFGSWYLVAASYNMGENAVRRLIKRHKTNSFWDLADRGALPEETRNYVPKMLAAMLIAKAPALYGFRDLDFWVPFSYETVEVPGGTDIVNLANHLGVSERALTELNPELLRGFIPREVKNHRIRIPKGSQVAVLQYVNATNQ